jgi:hypothetical protein
MTYRAKADSAGGEEPEWYQDTEYNGLTMRSLEV